MNDKISVKVMGTSRLTMPATQFIALLNEKLGLDVIKVEWGSDFILASAEVVDAYKFKSARAFYNDVSNEYLVPCDFMGPYKPEHYRY